MELATAKTIGTAFTIGGWSIQWYGIIIATALLIGIGIVMRMFRRKGLDPETVLDMALVVVPLAIVGARAHYVLWSWNEFAGRPFWHVFAVWEGGMAIFGSVLLGGIGAFFYARWKKLSFFTLADCLVPALALGQAIGRWGNFANQEVYGAAVTDPGLQWFPASVFIQATGQYHYALFFYESVFNLCLFCLLFFVIGKRKTRAGTAFWTYLLCYGACRCFLEGFREEMYIQRTFGLPMNQVFAGCIAVIAAGVLIARAVQARRAARESAPVSDDLVILHEQKSETEDKP